MKKTIFYLACAVSCVLFASGVNAQVVGPGPGCNGTVDIINNSGDDWTISYYNTDIDVDAGDSQTLGFVGADITTGRGVLLTANPNDCNYKFQSNPDGFVAFCAANTSQVFYSANEISPGCFNTGTILIQP